MMTTRKNILCLITIAAGTCLTESALSQITLDLDGLLGRTDTRQETTQNWGGGTLSFPRGASGGGRSAEDGIHATSHSLSWAETASRQTVDLKRENAYPEPAGDTTYAERSLELTPVRDGNGDAQGIKARTAGGEAAEVSGGLDQATTSVVEEIVEAGTQVSDQRGDELGATNDGGSLNTGKLEALDAVAGGVELSPPTSTEEALGDASDPAQEIKADHAGNTVTRMADEGSCDADGAVANGGGAVQSGIDKAASSEKSNDEGQASGTGAVSVDLTEGSDEDPRLDRVDIFVEKIRLDPEMAEAAGEAREECGKFSLEYYLSPSERGAGSESIKFWEGMDDLVFTVVPVESWGKDGALGDDNKRCLQPKCGGEGGVSPDGHRAVREVLFSKVASANADLARGGLLAIVERLARQESDSLRRALDFEEAKLEAGTGLVAKVAGLRAQIAEVEADLAWARREVRGARNQFEEATGLPFTETWESVKSEQGLGGAWADTESDVNFSEIFKLAATVARDNEEGARLMQELAGEVVAGVGRANRQKGVSNLADEALRKTREAFDSGRMQGGGVAEAEAFLLRAQRAEVEAMTGLAVAKATAYPPLALEVLDRTPGPQWLPAENRNPPSWVLAAALTFAAAALALAVILLFAKMRKSHH